MSWWEFYIVKKFTETKIGKTDYNKLFSSKYGNNYPVVNMFFITFDKASRI